MMTHKKYLFIILIIAVMVGFLLVSRQVCFAAFSIAVEPFGGGYDLRFGTVDSQDAKVIKEITLRITTDIAKQYRVYQRIDQPLRTADGIEINPHQFKMYTLINSNSKGTLERIEEFPVMMSDTLLYTANTTGDADSFKVVYTLEPAANQSPGSYYGRIIYILRPIDSSQDQAFVTFNMYADLSNEGTVEITTSSGFNTLRISSSDLDKITPQYPSVLISVKGNLGAPYRIYQKLREPVMKSAEADTFDLTKVTYEAKDAKTGTILRDANLSELQTKVLIYSSDDLGSGNDIVITYKPTKDFALHKAGFYTGAMNYYLESERPVTDREGNLIDAVNLEFEVEKIFRIVAVSLTEDGKTEREGGVLLEFGDVGYKTGAKESKVRLKIESNLAKPYLVTQKLAEPLQNEEGSKIPDEQFNFVLKKVDEVTQGKLKFEEPAIFESGKDISLFVSNSAGESDEFDITYALKTTPDTRGGNYTTRISYSVTEL